MWPCGIETEGGFAPVSRSCVAGSCRFVCHHAHVTLAMGCCGADSGDREGGRITGHSADGRPLMSLSLIKASKSPFSSRPGHHRGGFRGGYKHTSRVAWFRSANSGFTVGSHASEVDFVSGMGEWREGETTGWGGQGLHRICVRALLPPSTTRRVGPRHPAGEQDSAGANTF